jgi:hypothetical protein
LVISATKLHNQQVLDYSGMRFEDFLQLGWKKYMHPNDFSQNSLCWSSMTIQTSELRLAVCCQRLASMRSCSSSFPTFSGPIGQMAPPAWCST